VGVEGDAVDDGSDEARVGEHGSSFAERQVRADGDGGSFFSFGDDLEEQFGAARVELDVAELVEQEQVEAAVAADDAGQLPLVGGFGELVNQLGGGGVADPAALLAGGQAQADQQMGLARAGSDGDRLQHLRSVLPCSVRVTAAVHPLFGELLAASGFRRSAGVVYLVVELPDGSPGTIRAEATDVLVAAGQESVAAVLDAVGVRALRALVAAMCGPGSPRPRRRHGK
jgi:hypothetical protein